MTDKKAYLQNMADQFQQWDADINELKVKTDTVKTNSRSELLKQIDELRTKHEIAQDKLKQLWTAGDETWYDIKASVEKSWWELGSAFSNVYARF